jgi:hypothetical protein
MSANDLRDKMALVAAGSGKTALDGLKAKQATNVAKTNPAPICAIRTVQCLLLDVSGSMAEDCEPGRSKWDALRKMLGNFFGVRMYAFASECIPCSMSIVGGLAPGGTTDMAKAFRVIKRAGVGSLILITDGEPNDEEDALRAAAGLRIDIFYVGAGPRPSFLDRLAAACRGTAQTANLAKPQELTAKIKPLLALPAPESKP